MSINPIEDNSTPKPTGSLEDLFRHHLGEEAAVPPRPMLWDQIDNALLIRQNETYRRRLLATRWVAAASLLLATLAGTGWWAHRASDMSGPEVATTGSASSGAGTSATGAAAGQSGLSGTAASAAGQAAGSISTNRTLASSNNPATLANAAVGSSNRTSSLIKEASSTGTFPIAANSASGVSGSIATRNAPEYAATEQSIATGTRSGLTPEATGAYGQAAIAARTTPPSSAGTAQNGNAAGLTAGATAPTTAAASTGTAAGSGISGAAAGTSALGALAQTSAASLPEQVGLLAASPASLALAAPAALPQGLAGLSEAELLPTPAVQKWHYGGSYTAGVFNPNINFSRVGIEPVYGYNPALGAGSPELTETAAAQYRANLRPGLSQRIALLATRHLGGHWSLSSGAELSQATAQSASSAAFVGEQILDLGRPNTGPLRTTDFRYRTAGIPVEVRYSNPVKRGWSLYGRLGGAVTALLGVRSEVEGNPEATRTYSLTSAGTPYRRVLANVRAGLGAQYRPAGHNWALTVGPTADAGLMSLNAHPAQNFLKESRAYGYGLEVAVEFGK